jgi:hypothetical protein
MTTAERAARLLFTCVLLLFMLAANRRGQYISVLMLALAMAPLHAGRNADERAVTSAIRWAASVILVVVAGLVAS